MCKECGCGHEGGSNTRLQFTVHGYTEEIAQEVETELLGMPGVLYVHIHAHDGDACLFTVVQDRMLDRRRAPVGGKQGRVDVEAAVFRNIQKFLRQDLPERGHDDDIGLHFTDTGNEFRVAPHFLWLKNPDLPPEGFLADRPRRDFLLSSARAVRLRDDSADVMSRFAESFQHMDCKIRGSHKHCLHFSSSSSS